MLASAFILPSSPLAWEKLEVGSLSSRAGQPFLRRWRAGDTALSSLQSWHPDCPLRAVVSDPLGTNSSTAACQ